MDMITLRHLHGACREQRALFRQVFPDGAPVTVKSAEKALEAGLDVFWLWHLLPRPTQIEFNRTTAATLAEFERAAVPARAEYDRIMAPARAEYSRAVTATQTEDGSDVAAALAEFERAAVPARAEYSRAVTATQTEYVRTATAALVAAFLTINLEVA
jgi:hypothetical protein